MDILFILTGFICAGIVPFLNFDFLHFKGVLFFFIMLLFAMLVLAYVILSIFKSSISKIDYLKSRTIVGWNLKEKPEKKASIVPYIISLICGVILGTVLIIEQVSYASSILIALALAFIILGLWLMGIKRLEDKRNSTPDFLLSHIGMILNSKIYIFNGVTKGITGVTRNDNTLILNLLSNKKETEIKLDIPEDKIDQVDAFIDDLNKFFRGEGNEIQ